MNDMHAEASACRLCGGSPQGKRLAFAEFFVLQCTRCGFRFIDTADPGYPADAQGAMVQYDLGTLRWNLPHIQRRVREALRFVRPPALSLDVGCGRGETVLAMNRKGFRASGLDISSSIISQLQRRHPEASWHCGSLEEIERTEKKFDLITLYHVIEHVPRPVELLQQVKRMVRPGGYIVIEVPNASGLHARLKGLRWHYFHKAHLSYFRPGDLRRLASICGLKVQNMSGYFHFGYPQDVAWKDAVKGLLARAGFKDVLSMTLVVP